MEPDLRKHFANITLKKKGIPLYSLTQGKDEKIILIFNQSWNYISKDFEKEQINL